MRVVQEVTDENVQAFTVLKLDGAIDGSEEYKQIFAEFFDGFPLASPLVIKDFFAVDDRLVCRFRSVRNKPGIITESRQPGATSCSLKRTFSV